MQIRQKLAIYLILDRWIRIRNWFFSITSLFITIANFMVARSKNQFFAFREKSIGNIENLNTFLRFKFKFCAFKKKSYWKSDIGHLSWRDSKKKRHFRHFFNFKNMLWSVRNQQNVFSKVLFNAESGYEINFFQKWLV